METAVLPTKSDVNWIKCTLCQKTGWVPKEGCPKGPIKKRLFILNKKHKVCETCLNKIFLKK